MSNSKGTRGLQRGKQRSHKARRTVRIRTTLGALIAAAFDAVGDEVRGVAKLVSSPGLSRSMGVRIVLV